MRVNDMKNKFPLIFISLFFIGAIYPQVSKLEKTENKYKNLIQVGSTTDEVRLKLGKPKEVNPGFPDESEGIKLTYDFEYHGQMNYTSWIYYKDVIKVKRDQTEYYINGLDIPKGVYEAYTEKNMLYLKDTKIIYPTNVSAYKNMGDRVDSVEITSRDIKPKEGYYNVATIVCIIFEKATLSVSAVRVYFVKI